MNISLILNTEWLKIKKYNGFWWMLGIVAITYPSISYISYKFITSTSASLNISGTMVTEFLGNVFAFPEVWHSVAYLCGFFVLVPIFLVVMLITNEYSFKTHKQNIIDGWSKEEFMVGKLLSVSIISVVATVMFSITALIFGIVSKSEGVTASMTAGLGYILLFFLETFAHLSIAFMLGLLCKKAIMALGIYFAYAIIGENLLKGLLLKVPNLIDFLPLQIVNNLIPLPRFIGKSFNETKYNDAIAAIPYHIGYVLVLVSIIWGICFYVFRQRDL